MKMSDIENSIKYMDETYDANFGDWIRNEENVRIVAHNLKKYVNLYSADKFIIVLKYVVKDWTLRSIIVLIKKIFDKEINVEIVQGLVYTWNSIFIAEFVVSLMKNKGLSDKAEFVRVFFDCFEKEKINQILSHMESKIEGRIREVIVELTNKKVKPKSKKLLKAYQIN